MIKSKSQDRSAGREKS